MINMVPKNRIIFVIRCKLFVVPISYFDAIITIVMERCSPEADVKQKAILCFKAIFALVVKNPDK